MVVTSSTSQTRTGTGTDKEKEKVRRTKSTTRKRNTRSTLKKSEVEKNTEREIEPKELASNDKKPLNHNALIATSANDTLDNIRVSLDMIREMVCSDNDGMALSDDTKQGLFLHIENLIKALSFLRTL